MRQILGLLICVAAVIGGLYAGIWWAFIGGFVDVIQVIQSTSGDAAKLAIGIAKIVFSGLIGWTCFAVGMFAGAMLAGS